jgi:lactate dehydrogenase-like 2-hydroxyacid dehydrogenase
VHVTGELPARVREALAESFTLADGVEGADGILSVLTTAVDGELLDRAGQQLRIVANYGVGVDNVDLEAARARNVLIANTPDVLTDAVAELTIALTLALLRRVAEGDRFLRRQSRWSFSLDFMLGRSLRGKTFGVVGAGRIGRAAASLAEALGARAIFAGRNADDLDALLETSDVVSLHCPLTPDTRHLIDASALARMRPTSVLVNTARGPIVDEPALVAALGDGTIAGAALDVYEHEPEVSAGLLELENVVLTPHVASATPQTREAMGMLAVEALRAVLLEDRVPPNTVP